MRRSSKSEILVILVTRGPFMVIAMLEKSDLTVPWYCNWRDNVNFFVANLALLVIAVYLLEFTTVVLVVHVGRIFLPGRKCDDLADADTL